MSTARDFSVMPMQVAGEPKAFERAVRSRGSLKAGSFVDVEFGATWGDIQGKPVRIDGQWRQCRVTRHEGATVHVVLGPKPAQSAGNVLLGRRRSTQANDSLGRKASSRNFLDDHESLKVKR